MVWDLSKAIEGVSAEVRALEHVRQKILKQRSRGWILTVGVILLMLGCGIGLGEIFGGAAPLFISLFLGVVALIVIYHYCFSKGARAYRHLYKDKVFKKLIQQVEPDLHYRPGERIAQNVFDSSGLFGERVDRYSGEDLFSGKIGQTQVSFSEVHAEEKKTRQSNNRAETYYQTIFKGVFFIADFHKKFRNPVSVLPDIAERHFGWFGKKLQRLSGRVQFMENTEFEKLFVVRGADAVETRYILTPKMQQALMDLRTRVGPGLRVGFRNSHVWIALPNEGDWFEPDLQTRSENQAQLRSFLAQLRCFTQIIEELDLNTRIWTK